MIKGICLIMVFIDQHAPFGVKFEGKGLSSYCLSEETS
jgi:hypothetical protein